MSTLKLRLLNTRANGFKADFERLFDRAHAIDPKIETTVRDIVADVRARGDAAVVEYTRRFDRREVDSVKELEVSRARLREVSRAVTKERSEALANAAERIRAYHERQRTDSWTYTEPDGTLLGQQVTALERVGLYVPGGKAAYPSSVLMNAIPAKVAEVPELVMVVPAPEGTLSEMVLAAAYLGGVDRVFTIGGAQAVAALAYGTQTVPKVDKIVGPGNVYVATAKRLVYGVVDIDMIAGPSEIVVLCDGGTDPEWIAMDLFSQAEHDEDAQSILISLDEAFTMKVLAAIEKLLPGMERREIIRASLESRGALITAGSLDEALLLVNSIAPEHLELSVENAGEMARRVRHAGAIFLGRYTAEAVGDYCAGPNHVLPTSGTARFSSPLGVYDFQKRTSLIQCSAAGASGLGKLDAMENPYSWPEDVRREWMEVLQDVALNRYPDPDARRLRERLRTTLDVPVGMELILGNGSDELIQTILMAVSHPNAVVLAPTPPFVMYEMIATFTGMKFVGVPLQPDFSLDMPAMLKAIETHKPAVIFLAYPNNPTGNLFSREDVARVIEASPGLAVLDEAYHAFAGHSFMDRLGKHDNLLVMRTLSKQGLAGLRLGILAGLAPWLAEFNKVRLPYNIGSLTQASAEFALTHLALLY